MYESEYADTLEAWQASSGYDESSIAADGGACSFADAPTDASDDDFDVTIEEVVCADLDNEGMALGACSIARCVGAFCEACD